MIPRLPTTPPQQQRSAERTYKGGGVNGPDVPRANYSMVYNASNWIYFGTTGFPASATLWHGQARGPVYVPPRITW